MIARESIFDQGWVVPVVFLPALAVPMLVLHAAEDAPGWLAVIAAAATCIPTALAVFFPLYWIDRSRRGDRSRSDATGVTLHGLLYMQAAVFLYAPLVVTSSEDGSPLIDLTGLEMVVCWVFSGITAWAGYAAKKRRGRKLALAKLAETNANLATRFLVRTDAKGWAEIEPSNVLRYQRWFEKSLSALGTPLPSSAHELTDEQERQLVTIACEARYSEHVELWPSVILGLVLAFLFAPAADRERDRTEWAAAVATRTNASQWRDSVQPISMRLFDKHPCA